MEKIDLTKFETITGVERHILVGDGMLGAGDASALFNMPGTPQEGFAEGWNRRAEIALLLEEESQKQVSYSHEIAFVHCAQKNGWIVLTSNELAGCDGGPSPKTIRFYGDLANAIAGNWELKLWDLPSDKDEGIKSPVVDAWLTSGVDILDDRPTNRLISVVLRATKYDENELYDVRVHHKGTVRLAVAYNQEGVWYEQGTNNELLGRVELEDGSDGVMHKEPENPDDTLTDSWHILDVRSRDEATEFTDDQCREVLRRVKANLDRERGINYDVLDVHIDALIDEVAQAARNTSAPTNQG
jgi:hypothetical protein